MIPRLLLAILLALPAAADDWLETRSGPFVVFSDAGRNDARAALYHLEQFRFLFGESLGKTDLRTALPITVVVTKKPATTFGLSRDGWLVTWPAGSTPPPAFFHRLALLFIEDNLPGRMPGDLEPAFAALYSTLTLARGKATLGAPPAPPQRTRAWATLQYLLTNPETATRTRVFLSNLASGADDATAFRNAFEKPKAAFDQAIDAYLAAANFQTVTIPAKPLNPDIAFSFIPLLPSRLRVLAADLLLAQNAAPAQIRAAYQQAINERPGPLGFEGLGLALLEEGHRDDARKAFETMKAQMDASLNTCARGLLELGLYDQAAQKAPRWPEPYVRAAAAEKGPVRRAYFLKKAAELAPRNPDVWRDLAQAQFDSHQFPEAERSWHAAARVARSETERAELMRAREAFEQARYDAQAAERARLKKEEQDEVERARQQMLANIKKAEDAANRGSQPAAKPEKWWDGPATQSFTGTLESVACQGQRARLAARDLAAKPASFLIADPSKVVIFGANQTTVQLSCGPQKPPRRVKIEYVPRANAPGDVVSLEFQ